MNAPGHPLVTAAVRHFWKVRLSQARRQGRGGSKDAGQRAAVTGGRQLDGFITFVRQLLLDAGLSDEQVVVGRRQAILPGYFRPTKEWDIVAIVNENLLATIEFKSHVGPSFGNNFNNRTEEAIGSAHDLWTAYREGAFSNSPRPWLGYLMLLEECPGSVRKVGVDEPNFPVFQPFKDSSYAHRYAILCERLVRERLYDAACLLTSSAKRGPGGQFAEPRPELTVARFAASLESHASTYLKYLGT